MPKLTPASPRKAASKNSARQSQITFDAFVVNFYLPYAKTRKRSWQVDERIARRHISAAFGSQNLAAIESFAVEQWLAGLMDRGLAPATCNRILAVFKSICAFAEKSGHLQPGASPARSVGKFKIYERRERFLSDREAKMLMDELRGHDCQAAKVLRLLLLTGARKSEILKARWENINLENSTLTVPLAKGGKPRHIVLSGEAVSLIKGIAQVEGSPWLFPGRDPAKPLSDIYNFWDSIRKKLGLDDVRIHDLRHTFASFLVNAGRSLYEAQQLLGHADPRTTMRYAHLALASLQDAVNKVSFLVSGNMAQGAGGIYRSAHGTHRARSAHCRGIGTGRKNRCLVTRNVRKTLTNSLEAVSSLGMSSKCSAATKKPIVSIFFSRTSRHKI